MHVVKEKPRKSADKEKLDKYFREMREARRNLRYALEDIRDLGKGSLRTGGLEEIQTMAKMLKAAYKKTVTAQWGFTHRMWAEDKEIQKLRDAEVK